VYIIKHKMTGYIINNSLVVDHNINQK